LDDSCEAGVDAVEERRLVLLHLSWDRRVHQLISAAARAAAAAAEARKRGQSAGALAFVVAVRVGADFGVRAAEQLVVQRRIHSRDSDTGWRRRRLRNDWRFTATASSRGAPSAAARTKAEAGGEIELSR